MTTTRSNGLVFAFLLGISTFGTSHAAWAGAAIAAKVSPLGIGVELTNSVTDKLNTRVGGNIFDYEYTGTEDDIEYDFDLRLRSLTGLLDIHPTGGGFRLTGGIVNNRNKLDATSAASGSYDIGGRSYPASQVGTLTGRVDFRRVSPYAGIGWGNAVASDNRVGFVFDLGVVFQGATKVALTASGPAASSSQFQNDLRQEQDNLQEDLKVFKYYPVVALGISIKF